MTTRQAQRERAESDHWHEKALDWPLDDTSIVVEVGGYEGEWAEQIVKRYGCRLYVFEPQWWAYEACLRRLRGTDAQVFHFGLSDGYRGGPMYSFHNDGATFVQPSGQAAADGRGDLREAAGVFEGLRLTRIDLMQVNIEGYEFALLPHLERMGWLSRIEYLTVQYHPHAGDLNGLTALIGRTHRLLWDGTQAAWVRA